MGPSSNTGKTIRAMALRGMDVARLNFSWGTYDGHAALIFAVRDVSKRIGKKILIVQDLSGPRLQKKIGHHFDANVKAEITKKDLRDLEFGLAHSVDYVAMSYVGDAREITQLRNIIKKSGKRTRIIAKIERKKGLKNLGAIIKAADAIMIARGDLGNEVPLEQIPRIEKEIIAKCKSAKMPVITATQMLLSMTAKPEPTRAEVTDVYFAIANGSDAVMLSEETANGKYPVEAVSMMRNIIREADKHINTRVYRL